MNKNRSLTTWPLPIVAVGMLASGCATPPENTALTSARQAYTSAASDTNVKANEEAMATLKRSRESLANAEHSDVLRNLFHEKVSESKISDQAYVAEQLAVQSRLHAENEQMEAKISRLTSEVDNKKVALAETREAKLQASLARARAAGADVNREGNRVNVTLRDVTFELNEAAIRDEYKGLLETVAEALVERYPSGKLTIEGHTDTTGTEEFNKKLSAGRAASVKAFLIQEGLDEERIATRGMGASSPIASNETREGRIQNRRVEIIFSGLSE